jgi:hypothetical protein
MGAVLERPQAPARHRLDVGAFYRMAEAGILSQPERVELIDGDIFDINPIGIRHAAVTRRLEQQFARAAADGMSSSASRIPCGSTPITSPSRISWP